jgi:hypothetical protein
MEEGLSWEGWIDAIREGALFVTNGPLLRMTVEGERIGSTIRREEPGDVLVEGSIQSIAPLTHAELIVNGERIDLGDIEQARGPLGETRFSFSKRLRIDRSSWITLQAYHDEPIHPIDDRFPQATTNPVWVMVGDAPIRSEASADYFIRWIDALSAMAAEHPGWRSEAEKNHVLGQFREAQKVYEARRDEARRLGLE